MIKTPFTRRSKRSKKFLDLIHTDVCEPMTICVIGGYTYFITFTNYHSRYSYVCLMKHNSESFERFKEFINEFDK